MAVTILTNGTCLTADDATALARHRVRQVSISVYGDTADLHDAITGVPGSFKRSVGAIRSLRRVGVTVRVATVLMKENVHSFDGVRRLAEDFGCDYRFEPTVRPMSDGDRSPLRHRLSEAELYELFADPVIGPRTAEGKWAKVGARGVVRAMNACAAGVSAVYVDATGTVFPCPGFLPGFGNVSDRSFAGVWGGVAAEDFRRRMSEPVGECEHCDDRQFCLSRCACLAAMEDGSLSGRSERACEIARVTRRLAAEGDDQGLQGASALAGIDAGRLETSE
jgi:radical SAM protein with 4Fe4S-binding SPASM domain